MEHKHSEASKRLKTIEGHVRGIQRMLEEDAYCMARTPKNANAFWPRSPKYTKPLPKVNYLILKKERT
jgi:hypothetical protein